MILANARERTRFYKFLVVGMIGFVVDFGVFNLLSHLVGIPTSISQGISFACAVVSNFTINRYWTYPDSRSKPVASQLFTFTVVSLIGLGIRSLLFFLIEGPLIRLFERVRLPVAISPNFLGSNLTLMITVLIVMLWNFFVNRFWTYSDVE